MNRDKAAWVAGGAAVIAVVILPIAVEPVRLLYAVAFCLLVPGAGWAYRAGEGDAADRLSLALVISMSVTTLLATAMVVTDTWSVSRGVAILAAIALLGFVPFTQTSRT